MLVLGLDGATFDLLSPWMAAGDLPVLARLAREGVSGILESTLPPVTAPAWASFMTGKFPSHHGVRDFFEGRAGQYRMISGHDVQGKTLWELLSEAGKTAGVINVPITYPPRQVNGFLIPGLLSPDQGQTTYPPGLLKDYESTLGPYRVTPRLVYQAGNEEAFLADIWEVLDTRIRYALRLAKDFPTDFLMVHFLVTDIAQHTFWKHLDPTHPWHDPKLASRYGESVKQIFARVDEAIGQLIEVYKPDCVWAMSDHGFGPLHGVVNLNLFLIEQGLMQLKRTNGVRFRTWAFRAGLGSVVAKVARRVGVKWNEKLLDFNDVDWTQTKAYSMGHLGQVFLNVQGREPEGSIQPSDYNQTLEQVRGTLNALHGPNGQRLKITTIPGTDPKNGPDLHVIIENYRYAAHPLFASDGKIISEQRHFNSGEHRREGVMIAWGEGIRPGERAEGARIIDLAPTILHQMGVSVPADMDGQVLTQVFSESWNESHPVRFQVVGAQLDRGGDLSVSDQAVLESRLRALGYMGGET